MIWWDVVCHIIPHVEEKHSEFCCYLTIQQRDNPVQIIVNYNIDEICTVSIKKNFKVTAHGIIFPPLK